MFFIFIRAARTSSSSRTLPAGCPSKLRDQIFCLALCLLMERLAVLLAKLIRIKRFSPRIRPSSCRIVSRTGTGPWDVGRSISQIESGWRL